MSETHRCDFDVFWFISIFSQTALSIKSEWWWLGRWRRGTFWTENYQLLIHNLWFSVDRKNDDNNKKILRTRKLKTATTTNKTSSERKIIGLNVSFFYLFVESEHVKLFGRCACSRAVHGKKQEHPAEMKCKTLSLLDSRWWERFHLSIGPEPEWGG